MSRPQVIFLEQALAGDHFGYFIGIVAVGCSLTVNHKVALFEYCNKGASILLHPFLKRKGVLVVIVFEKCSGKESSKLQPPYLEFFSQLQLQ